MLTIMLISHSIINTKNTIKITKVTNILTTFSMRLLNLVLDGKNLSVIIELVKFVIKVESNVFRTYS